MKVLPLRAFRVLSLAFCAVGVGLTIYWVVNDGGPYRWTLRHFDWAGARAPLLAVLVALLCGLLCALAGILLLLPITDRSRIAGETANVDWRSRQDVERIARSPRLVRAIGAGITLIGGLLLWVTFYLSSRDGRFSIYLFSFGLAFSLVGGYTVISGKIPRRPGS